MVLKLLHIYCYPSKYSWNFRLIMKITACFLNVLRDRHATICSAFLEILLYDHPDCIPAPHGLIPIFAVFVFLLPLPSFFSRSYPSLPLILLRRIFYYPQQPVRAFFSFCFHKMISHILYFVTFSVFWFCSAIFVTDDFSALQFFLHSLFQTTEGACGWRQGRAVPISQSIILCLSFSLYIHFSVFS